CYRGLLLGSGLASSNSNLPPGSEIELGSLPVTLPRLISPSSQPSRAACRSRGATSPSCHKIRGNSRLPSRIRNKDNPSHIHNNVGQSRRRCPHPSGQARRRRTSRPRDRSRNDSGGGNSHSSGGDGDNGDSKLDRPALTG